MEPPTYEEAALHPPARNTQGLYTPPPPSYYASLSSPSTPPPTYVEAVRIQRDPFPILSLPSVPTSVTSTPRNAGYIIHPLTQVGATQTVNSSQTQPTPVPIRLSDLTKQPGLVRCPHCRRTVTTNVKYHPSKDAWGLCILLAVMGLICGFCLIPLIACGLQDAYHSCPECGRHLFTYKRPLDDPDCVT
ncbi:lipopolysaccharide-induced tumor necrosis factor-alpha factor homolog [Hippoglossus hippoglossus]|uniref:lipopolysaccharide-induced tumor necrosis factor-alpha factor homolog n=1 Tax=Hippoglossus hippoglossus TaxID=8267 RepID=UPI00148DD840|nr:lipopolysaccharide-induced tumor necrosis factor-alpha factor homolog [Hippoglossus hippoglossus]XP_034455062.1 lipopolysaccharide-induced tumor necrosis factor-alpha factor homolog [Hippoglossus hippoglossus]